MAELLRRQYLVTEDNVEKLKAISKSEGVSATEVVRRAIEAYQPRGDAELEKLVEMMSESVHEAIQEVRYARKVVQQVNKEFRERKAS